jgi:hypothetical protein
MGLQAQCLLEMGVSKSSEASIALSGAIHNLNTFLMAYHPKLLL